ncbi:substrate-binding periplasmic protein [Vibrio algarum]|uniref:Transporter substrate-binding domain-containing protein n=1 Tax=Vibrio algarum TaxID=3020714 RepID=A0ABT4YQX9_9VIBR|nr:transporter substrate-binding domain-containing protein [Vibrio sp. KJ40-1]MDB1123895.1 transporter substrate-binding domain-containing protein [Vibrio sp. KJ40-1]
MLFLSCSRFAQCESLRIFTENYPPYNYVENRELKGVSADIVREALDRAHIDYTIETTPWARAIEFVNNTPNAFIFSIQRVPRRENQFVWVAPLVSSSLSAFIKSNQTEIIIRNIKDFENYIVGTTLSSAVEELYIENGVSLKNMARIGGEEAYIRNFKKLKFDRIDIWPTDDNVAYYTANKFGSDNKENELVKVFSFNEGRRIPYYLATNSLTNSGTVNKVAAAIKSFKETDEYRLLLKSWSDSLNIVRSP